MRLVPIAALVAGLAVAGGADAATNFVKNGSFELGTPQNPLLEWTYSGVNVDATPATIIDYNSATPYPTGAFGEAIPNDDSNNPSPDAVGDHAAYFVSDHATETLSQSVFLEAGLYTIGFSAYVPLNGFTNAFDASFIGSVAGENLATFTVDGSTPGTWKHFSGVANVTQAGDYLTQFTFNSGGFPAGDVVIDRVYIVAGDVTGGVPEPATWAMMLIGFGGAGAVLRRRRGALLLA